MEGAKEELTGGWSRFFPDYTPEQLFDLVSNVESYPRFLPGCTAARIKEQNGDLWIVDNVFAIGPMRSRFESQARAKRPNLLSISSSDGPWKEFNLTWELEAEGDGCRVTCKFSVSFASKAIAAAARLGLKEMDRRIISGFEKQAAKLYGPAQKT